VYTLQAFLNAGKSVSATSVFEVVTGYGGNGGIKGLVLKEVKDLAMDIVSEVPASGADVRISEIVTPAGPRSGSSLTFATKTDSEGRFVINAPQGYYRVEASDPSYGYPPNQLISGFVIWLPAIPVATSNVTVQADSFSDVMLHLKGGGNSAVITQGIRGTVSLGASVVSLKTPITAVSGTLEFDASTVRITRFSVRVEQLDSPEGTAPFQWNGSANYFGRFQVATPPGRFRVTAMDLYNMWTTNSIPPSIGAPTVSAEVTVAPQAVTGVDLVIPGWGVVFSTTSSAGQ
jgi:hypothetical protein